MHLEPAITFTRALTLALLDSERTDQLLIGEEISSIARMATIASDLTRSAEGRAILAERPRLSSTTVDLGALRALPHGTLGRAFAAHLDDNGLDLDDLGAPVTRGATPLANYMLERIRQTHDLWHTVLGLGTRGHEEVLVHAFQWPQLRMPYSALVVLFGTVKHVIGEARWPVLSRGLRDAVAAGRAARPLVDVYWERHWDEPLDALRARLAVRPAATWRHARA